MQLAMLLSLLLVDHLSKGQVGYCSHPFHVYLPFWIIIIINKLLILIKMHSEVVINGQNAIKIEENSEKVKRLDFPRL
jgi:hypothetical protein